MGRKLLALQGAVLCALLSACSGVEMKPGDQPRNAREIREGPGMLTGADGEFVIFRIDKVETPDENAGETEPADSEAAGAEEGEWRPLQ